MENTRTLPNNQFIHQFKQCVAHPSVNLINGSCRYPLYKRNRLTLGVLLKHEGIIDGQMVSEYLDDMVVE